MSEPIGPGWAPKKPPPSGDHEPPPTPRRFWWRFLLAGAIIVAVSAATTSASVLTYFDAIAKDITPPSKKEQSEFERFLVRAEGGEPQNFLVLGSDKRAGPESVEDKGRSDTAMLVRIDPEQALISMLSIPRDLKVEIPEHGIGKFNEAYTYGGRAGTARTVTQLTGLPINHVVDINFLGFAQAVYEIGCVFTDVDRRYYHSNEGVPPSEQYAEINVRPGYQLMCGKKALDYVRYRHTDTDIVRSARQQDFLTFARQGIAPQDLFLDQADLIDVFTEYTTSDIKDGGELLDIVKLLIEARGATINQVHFPAELGPSYVYASKAGIEQAVDEFLGKSTGSGAQENRKGAEEQEQDKGKSKKGKKNKKGKGKNKKGKGKKKNKPVISTPKAGDDELVPARESGEEEARIAARRAPTYFPIYYPTRLPGNAFYAESNPYTKVVDPYVYRIRESLADDAPRHLAYRMVMVLDEPDGARYFGLQGIRGWKDPPILDSPTETKKIKGREFMIFADGGRISQVAWHRGENSYWISNDLLQTLSNDQMVGMARSVAAYLPKDKLRRRAGPQE